MYVNVNTTFAGENWKAAAHCQASAYLAGKNITTHRNETEFQDQKSNRLIISRVQWQILSTDISISTT